MKDGHVRKRHPKFFKRLTIGGSIFGVISTLAFIVILILDIIGVNHFLTDTLRTYTAEFYSEDALVERNTYRRGEELHQPEAPTKVMDGEKNYIFIGWDITGEGIPDILPQRMYFSFKAKAVFFGLGDLNFDLNALMNMDLDTLLQLLEDLNLDWEKLAELFNLSLEDLMKLLDKEVFRFDSSGSSYVSFFRSTSYGDFNYGQKKFVKAGIYDSNLISQNSVNPLRYTADKLNSSFASGLLGENFGFIDYDITYFTNKSPLPVPDCEIARTQQEEYINSDAYLLESAPDNKHVADAAFCPALFSVINILQYGAYSNTNIMRDEREYRQYARNHYLNVPEEYVQTTENIIASQGWDRNDYYYVDEVRQFVTSLGVFCMMDEETGKIHKNSDPYMGLLETHKGSDLDFNTVALMIFRRLGIPARMVQGYLLPTVKPGTNSVKLLNQHYWCEIYVDGIGWMICDCTECESMLGFNPYGDEYDNDSNPISDPIEEEEVIDDEAVSGDLSGDVSGEGPGDRLDEKEMIFTFTSPHEGTVYFKSRAYNTYNGAGQWETNDSYENYQGGAFIQTGMSPLVYTNKVATNFYKNSNFTITYNKTMKYGIHPQYPSNVTYKGSDLHGELEMVEGSVKSFSATDFVLSSSMLSTLAEKGHTDPNYQMHEQLYRAYLDSNEGEYLNLDSVYHPYFNELFNTYDLGSYNTIGKIIAVRDMFRDNYTYDINFAADPNYTDPVIAFLENKVGICNNFASAATLMYRYLGIPARFVTGYGANSQGTGFVNEVYNTEAHAWTEVYLNGVGWISVDATGFDDGHYDNDGYGGGFGGDGMDGYEEIINKKTLTVKYDQLGLAQQSDKYGTYYVKEYDNQPLPSGLVYVDGELRDGHYAVVDDSEIVPLGANAPGDYNGNVTVTIYDENGNDVTDVYYKIDDPGFMLQIKYIDLGFVTIGSTMSEIYYSGSDIHINESTYPGVFYIEGYDGALFPGHTIYFELIDNVISYDHASIVMIDGNVIIRDENGNDVTDYYSMDVDYPLLEVYDL